MSIRGLPDERPRPSVANLIGRFEQRASKRQSSVGPGGSGASASPTASPSQSRSTSVVSHTTGDSAVIEAKERREWPPQQFKNINNNSFGNITNGNGSGNDGLPMNAPSTAFRTADLRGSLEKTSVDNSMRGVVKSPPLNSSGDVQASVESEEKQDASAPPPPSANSEPSLVVEEVKSGTEKKEDVQPTTPMRAAGKITASKSSIPSSTHSGTRARATGKTATTPRPSTIAQSKSTSSKTSTSTPPAVRPLTAQRTGNSAAGAAARAGAKSPPVSTPSRAKTPTARGLRASTSGPLLKTASSVVADRAKTPTASPARAKTPTASASLSAVKHTPSSGLYAPTKASLARARNAEAPPPPVPKPAVSVSSLERLMKPTAASASKVRGPAPVPTSPPRAPPAGKNAKMTPTSPPAKGKTLKLRVGLAPARLKEERERKEKEKIAAATAAGASAAVATTVGAAAVIEPTSEDEHGHEHEHEQEQPSFISTTGISDTSLTHEKEHEEEESDHAGPPSDIESYDDAFASDDERALELDRAHLVSARPSAEGDKEPFAGTLEVPEVLPVEEVSEAKVAVEERESETVPAPASAEEEEEVVQVVPHSEPESELVDEELAASGPAESEPEPELEAKHLAQTEDSPIGRELEPKVEAEAKGPATPTSPTSKQNGLSVISEPETTEFDSVLNMLAVKPPASPVSIPDEEL
ncbi:hypothetical protein ACEPAI_6832 [Sanghuangporus weigelae]